MTEKLKPVSEAMRKVLALLGETPEEHQAELQSRGKQSGKRSHELPPAPKLSSASQVVAHWQEDPWRPDARVLFVRQTECLSCGSRFESPHWPETFIRQRLKGDRSGLNTHKYVPSRSALMSKVQLPHMIERISLQVHACHMCPDWQVSSEPKEAHSCLEDLLSPLVISASSPSQDATTLSTSSEHESASSNQSRPFESNPLELPSFGQISLPNSIEPTSGGFQFTSTLLSNSDGFALEQPAAAQPMSSLTLEAEATVCAPSDLSTTKI